MSDEIVREDSFTLVYEGDELNSGEMDVFELAPALLAVGKTFKAADTVLNGSETTVSTSVRAEFRKGSFEILFSIHQHLTAAAGGILPALHVLGADKLISAVIGRATDSLVDKTKEKIVSGLFKLLGVLKGEEPKAINYDESATANIFIAGDNNQVVVDQSTTMLYRDSRVRSSAARVAKPLTRKGDTYSLIVLVCLDAFRFDGRWTTSELLFRFSNQVRHCSAGRPILTDPSIRHNSPMIHCSVHNLVDWPEVSIQPVQRLFG